MSHRTLRSGLILAAIMTSPLPACDTLAEAPEDWAAPPADPPGPASPQGGLCCYSVDSRSALRA